MVYTPRTSSTAPSDAVTVRLSIAPAVRHEVEVICLKGRPAGDAAACRSVHQSRLCGCAAAGRAGAQQHLTPRFPVEGLSSAQRHGGVGGSRTGDGGAAQFLQKPCIPPGNGGVNLVHDLTGKGVGEIAERNQRVALRTGSAGGQSPESGQSRRCQRNAQGGTQSFFLHKAFPYPMYG